MSTSAALRQEIASGFYPERSRDEEKPLDRMLAGALGRLSGLNEGSAQNGHASEHRQRARPARSRLE